MIMTTTETEEPIEEESGQDDTSTTIEDPTWSPPASRTIGTVGDAMTTDNQTERIRKTSPNRRNASGGHDNRVMALERSAQQKNSSMDHERYMDSETREERSD